MEAAVADRIGQYHSYFCHSSVCRWSAMESVVTFDMVCFCILGTLAVTMAIYVFIAHNPVYSAYSLVGCFFLIGAMYATLGAHFLAAIQILIYTGAIMVLFIFVVMLITLKEDELRRHLITG